MFERFQPKNLLEILDGLPSGREPALLRTRLFLAKIVSAMDYMKTNTRDMYVFPHGLSRCVSFLCGQRKTLPAGEELKLKEIVLASLKPHKKLGKKFVFGETLLDPDLLDLKKFVEKIEAAGFPEPAINGAYPEGNDDDNA